MIDFTDRQQVISKLQELKEANLPHMDVEKFSQIDSYFSSVIKSATEEEKKVINEYLYPFYNNLKDCKCIFTDQVPLLSWTLTHGVAFDENTGLTWKCIHYFKIDGKEYQFKKALQYHPDNYEIEEEN